MRVYGKVYLSGWSPYDDEFRLQDNHLVEPNTYYYITEHGQFETVDPSGIYQVYAADAASNEGLLDDYMNDYEPDVDIIKVYGSDIIKLAGDKLNTFEDVYYAYQRQQKGEK
jgi:hypothetical protein